MRGLHLGIDLGTSSIKAVLTDGSQTYWDKEEYNGEHSLFMHPVDMVEETASRLINRILKKTDRPLSGMAIGGHGPSLVLVDKQGRATTGIVTWQDKRASDEAQELRERLTGFHRDGTSYEAKILWHVRHHPELFGEGTTALYPKDYLIFRLTGNRITDRSTASTIAFFDDQTNRWTDRGLGLDLQWFPKVIESTAVAGMTSTAFSRNCGLTDATPVYAGGIDAYCESLGAGAVSPGDLVDGTGTSTCLSVCKSAGELGDRHVIPERRLLMRTISYSGGSVRWMEEELGGIRELRQEEHLEIEPSKLVFLPYLTGERSPMWDEKARGVFLGLHNQTTNREMAMAVLEGVSYAIRQNLDTLDNLPDVPIRAVGGGAADPVWLQIKANITGRTYWQMENLDAGALGVAMISALGGGNWTAEELASEWVGIHRVYSPGKNHREAYDGLFHIYTGLYPQLKESFQKLWEIYSQLEHSDEAGRTNNA